MAVPVCGRDDRQCEGDRQGSAKYPCRDECAAEQKTRVYIVSEDEGLCERLEMMKDTYAKFLSASRVRIQMTRKNIGDDAVSIVVPECSCLPAI